MAYIASGTNCTKYFDMYLSLSFVVIWQYFELSLLLLFTGDLEAETSSLLSLQGYSSFGASSFSAIEDWSFNGSLLLVDALSIFFN